MEEIMFWQSFLFSGVNRVWRYLNPTPFLAMMQNSSSPAVRSILEVNIMISKEQLLGWIFPPRQLLPSHLYHRWCRPGACTSHGWSPPSACCPYSRRQPPSPQLTTCRQILIADPQLWHIWQPWTGWVWRKTSSARGQVIWMIMLTGLGQYKNTNIHETTFRIE